MKTADMIKTIQLHTYGTSAPTSMSELFLQFVDNKINNEVISNKFSEDVGYDEYFDKEWTGENISEKYKHKYGIKFTVREISDYYNLPIEYFDNFIDNIQDGIKELENKGYTINILHTYIYVMWINPDILKENFG